MKTSVIKMGGMKMSPSGALVGLSLLLALVSAGRTQSLTIDFNGQRFDLAERGAILADTVWEFPFSAAEKKIYVCWENPSVSDADHMTDIRQAISLSWEKHSRLRFIGWGACSPGSTGIRIRISDEGPHVKKIGRRIDGVHDGMVLNFIFQTWLPACQNGPRDQWIRDIAVHEFGHAIGFTHEQNRDDTPSWCTVIAGPQGTDPDRLLTPWDRESEMNYCFCDGDAELSAFDIQSVKQIY